MIVLCNKGTSGPTSRSGHKRDNGSASTRHVLLAATSRGGIPPRIERGSTGMLPGRLFLIDGVRLCPRLCLLCNSLALLYRACCDALKAYGADDMYRLIFVKETEHPQQRPVDGSRSNSEGPGFILPRLGIDSEGDVGLCLSAKGNTPRHTLQKPNQTYAPGSASAFSWLFLFVHGKSDSRLSHLPEGCCFVLLFAVHATLQSRESALCFKLKSSIKISDHRVISPPQFWLCNVLIHLQAHRVSIGNKCTQHNFPLCPLIRNCPFPFGFDSRSAAARQESNYGAENGIFI